MIYHILKKLQISKNILTNMYCLHKFKRKILRTNFLVNIYRYFIVLMSIEKVLRILPISSQFRNLKYIKNILDTKIYIKVEKSQAK